MNRITILLIFCTLFNFNLLSNDNFKKGYLITLNGDTIHGFLLAQNGINSYRNAIFKISLDGKEEEYSPEEIEGYRFIDGKYFVSIKLNTGPNKELKSVFMEYLIKGIISIYFYVDSQGDHYYIEKEPYGLRELSEPIKINNEGKISTSLYKGKLKSLMADCPEMDKDINSSQLNNSSLVSIAKKYHNYVCYNDSCIIYEKQTVPVSFSFLVTSGISYNNYRFGTELITDFGFGYHFGGAVKIQNGLTNPNFDIYVGLFLEKDSRYILKACDKQRLVTYNNIVYNINNYGYTISTPVHTSISELSIDIGLVALKVPILLDGKYNFEKFSIHCGFGVINKFILSSNKTFSVLHFQEQYGRTFNTYCIGPNLKLGVEKKIFNNHLISCSLAYEYLFDPIALNSQLRLRENNFSFILAYLF
jgi:hypothetical protein